MAILITGASGGLGAAVVETFLSAGSDPVFGVARSWNRLPSEDSRFHPLQADLGAPSECRRIAEEAGPVNALVHLVGGIGPAQPVASTSEESWRAMIEINLNTAFRMFRAVLPGMLDRKRGRIVAVGSRAALEPMANHAAYNVSKAGLVALVKTVALEARHSGITANVILPSIIDTPANRAAMPRADHSNWVRPESIARLIAWLASDEAPEINGAAIPIYGKD